MQGDRPDCTWQSRDQATKAEDPVQPSEELVQVAGGAWTASLNFFDSGGGCMVATQQVDEHVYVVGEESFEIARYDLAGWLNEVDQPEPPRIECFDAEGAWEMLRQLREDCLVWQCGACDAWIFTSDLPQVGALRCSTCTDGGVDFRHAHLRPVGGGE